MCIITTAIKYILEREPKRYIGRVFLINLNGIDTILGLRAEIANTLSIYKIDEDFTSFFEVL